MKYEYALYLFVILMIIVFLVDYYLINKKRLYLITNKGKNKKIKNIGELDYLIMKFKLDKKKINQNKAIFWIAIINSFIISSVSCVIMLIPLKLMWQMLIAFALLFALIYSIYEIYGRHLKKEEEK